MMRKYSLFILAAGALQISTACLQAQPKPSIYAKWEKGFTQSLQYTHDMALPSWGPYSNKFNGISQVPKANDGARFDLIVQPSFYLRNNITLASTQRESGYHPWQATPDLSYFSYRFELEWKDKVFCDLSFSKVDDKTRLIRAEMVNNTPNNRTLALNIFATAVYPYNKIIKAILPENVNWKNAADYLSLTDSVVSPNYNLVYNGQLRGQSADENAVSHTAITTSKNAGERLLYQFNNNRGIKNGAILFRYKTAGISDTKLQVSINGKPVKELNLPHTAVYTLV